eukprot:SAG25_NODE_229_length_11447_cov_5.927476_4_plen_300_part_00
MNNELNDEGALELLDGNHYRMDVVPGVTTNNGAELFIFAGACTVLIYVIYIPWMYYRKLRAASDPTAYWDGGKLCVGQELWSPEFSAKYSWFYSRYKVDSWNWEFVLMARKAVLAGIPVFIGNPAVVIVLSAAVVGLSLAHHKQSKPFRAVSPLVKEEALDGASVSQVSGGAAVRAGCCCCDWRWCFIGTQLLEVQVNTKDGQKFTGLLPEDTIDAAVASTTVYLRSDVSVGAASGKDKIDTAADKLELVSMLCLLGNYAVAFMCYLLNYDIADDGERIAALDGTSSRLVRTISATTPD